MRTTLTLAVAALLGAGGLVIVSAAPQGATPSPAQAPAKKQAAAPAASSAPAATPAAIAAVAGADEKPLREFMTSFIQAYNAGDAASVASHFRDDAAVIDSAGIATRGKADLTEMYSTGFQDSPGLKLEGDVEVLRFITPDVVQIEGKSRLSGGAAGGAVEWSKYSALLVRKDGKWKFAELRDYPMPVEDITPYERLQELEWMVGEWVDESENSRVNATIQWADNRSYLVRYYSVSIPGEQPKTGTMFIGWDPQSGQIKSWLFDSEGGHGEGLWTRTADNQWVVKAHGVLRDGRPTSATQIHTIVNKDAVKTASVDRIVGGAIAPDVPEIIMVRQPPQPGAPAEGAAPAASPAPAAPAAPSR